MDPHSKPKKDHRPQPSPSQLMSSAKVVAEAAKATIHHETEKMDKGKVAGAVADLIGSATHYAKLEEKNVGKYMEKAENYLHNYHSSHSMTTAATTTTTSTTHHSSSTSNSDHSTSSYGEYIKMAEGFLKKH